MGFLTFFVWVLFCIGAGIYCLVHGQFVAGFFLITIGASALLAIVCLMMKWRILGIMILVFYVLVFFILAILAATKGKYVDLVNCCAYGAFYTALLVLAVKWNDFKGLERRLFYMLFLAHSLAAAGVIMIIAPSPWLNYPFPVASIFLSLLFIILFNVFLQEQKESRQSIESRQ
jgi:hypothetical protein